MTIMDVGIRGSKVQIVADQDYLTVLKTLIGCARQYLYASLFIVDLDPTRDKDLLVDGLLVDLKAAQWRGIDVRLLVGGSRTNFEIAQLGVAAKMRADQLGIPCRLLESQKVRGSHVKMVIADQYVLAGSHNWSPGAFTDQTQDSLLIESADLAAYLLSVFERQWQRAEKGGA